MEQDHLTGRITTDPAILSGKPIIRGTRLAVSFIVGLLGQGLTVEELLKEYEGLTREDVLACLEYASTSLEELSFMPLTVEA